MIPEVPENFDVLATANQIAELEDITRWYYRSHSALWKRIVNHFVDDDVRCPLAALPQNHTIYHTNASYGVQFRSAHRASFDTRDKDNFVLNFAVNTCDTDDTDAYPSYITHEKSLLVPNSLEKNFTEAKYQKWVKKVSKGRTNDWEYRIECLAKHIGNEMTPAEVLKIFKKAQGKK